MASLIDGSRLSDRVLSWLLERSDPSPRYLALTRVLGRDEKLADVQASRRAIPDSDPARDILLAQYPQGYWMHPGVGYSPRYRATLWQILILAQLGMGRCEPVDRAVMHLFDANQRADGAFRASKQEGDTPIGLNSSLLWALGKLGYGGEPEVELAWAWLKRELGSIPLRERFSGGTAGTWSAVKVLWAANVVPDDRQDAGIERIATVAARVLLESPPEPMASDPRWFQLTFPLTEGADLLQWVEVLRGAGYGDDPRLTTASAWLEEKRRSGGTWPLERVPGKLWADFGELGKPNKWVTIRALAVQG